MQPLEPGATPRIPVFRNVPTVVLILTGAIVAATLVQFMASEGVEAWMFEAGAIIGGPAFEGLERPFGDVAPYFLHVFLHGGMFHLGMNMAALLSFGPLVAFSLGRDLRACCLFVLFFFACALGGAIAQVWQFSFQEQGVAIGASSAISGLLPAVGWLRGGFAGAVRTSAPWIVINIALAFFGGSLSIPIAWAAHLGGLAAGFLFPFFLSFGSGGRLDDRGA